MGWGYRTDAEGIRPAARIAGESVDELLVVAAAALARPQDVMHLMSLVSPVDQDLAVVYSRLLPVPFREQLLERAYRVR